MKKFIVTGGAGFIGSHICRASHSKGIPVISVDNLSAGYMTNIPKGVTNYALDVSRDVREMENLFQEFRPTMVFHQAASKKNICLENPVRDMEVNIQGAYNIAVLCKEYGVKMIHASTGSVYGEATGIQDEQHPVNPASFYGISKFAGERYARLIADAVALRYFHVYGPRQEKDPDRGGVIAIWIDRIKKGLPVIVFGDGEQERCFTYVKDVVRANLMDLKPGVYNCANPQRYTLNQLLQILKGMYGEFPVEYRDPLPGDVRNFKVNSNKIGFPDWTPLEIGLNFTRI